MFMSFWKRTTKTQRLRTCRGDVYWPCKRHPGGLFHIPGRHATGWENPKQWLLQTQTIAGVSAQGFVCKHCWKCSCSPRLPMATSNWGRSVPGKRVEGPFIHLVILQEWAFHAFSETQSGVKRERQAQRAVTVLVCALGLAGTPAVSLGAACPALVLAGTRREKKWEGDLAFSYLFILISQACWKQLESSELLKAHRLLWWNSWPLPP